MVMPPFSLFKKQMLNERRTWHHTRPQGRGFRTTIHWGCFLNILRIAAIAGTSLILTSCGGMFAHGSSKKPRGPYPEIYTHCSEAGVAYMVNQNGGLVIEKDRSGNLVRCLNGHAEVRDDE